MIGLNTKGRIRLLQVCLVLSLVIASQIHFSHIIARADADVTTKVYIQPHEYNATQVGQTFTMNVNIANVTSLFAYEFKLYYNTTFLNALSANLPSNHFLKPVNPGLIFVVKQEALDNFNDTFGRVWVSATLLAPESPKSGSGTLATITFNATALGGPSPLIFSLPGNPYPVKLSTQGATVIPCTADNGIIKVGVTIILKPALIYIDPATYTATSISQTFVMKVLIKNATSLYSYQYKLFYNKTVVKALSVDLPSDHLLKPSNSAKIQTQKEINNNYNSTHGRILFNATLLPPETAKNGDGPLNTITFETLSRGNTSLHLEDTKLSTPAPINLIPHITKDGQIISNPPVLPPVTLGGRAIDLFTQQEPYNGKGINKSSDAFPPQAEVILYANVTYRGEPVANKLVSFEVYGPSNPYYNHTISPRTVMSNESGMAMTSFSIPWPNVHPEETVFGIWHSLAKVEIVEQTVVDILTFKVGWIVELISISTIDENLKPKVQFAKGTCVGVELHIRNIALLPRNATIIVTASDALNMPFDSVMLNDFGVEPGETYIFTHCFLDISRQAAIGGATVNASAYTALPSVGGLPYCPEVSTTFVITTRDVAVISVVPSSTDVVVGQIVTITVTVVNKGNETETFSVSAYYGTSLIQMLSVTSLLPNQNRTITYIWNTFNVSANIYTIKAVAETVPGEIETTDNTYTDGAITVRTSGIPIFPRELYILALIVAAALAIFAIALLLTRRKKNSLQPAMLSVDVIHS